MQAVALVRNDIPKTIPTSLTEAIHQQQIQHQQQQIQQQQQQIQQQQQQQQIQQQQQQQMQQQIQQQQQQQPNTTTANIPQDIAIMSDNDLISYINPSCFDQGTLF